MKCETLQSQKARTCTTLLPQLDRPAYGHCSRVHSIQKRSNKCLPSSDTTSNADSYRFVSWIMRFATMVEENLLAKYLILKFLDRYSNDSI